MSFRETTKGEKDMDTNNKNSAEPEVNSIDWLALLDLKPQLSKPQHGTEPSLRELLIEYAESHGIIFPKSYADDYMNELKNMQANTPVMPPVSRTASTGGSAGVGSSKSAKR
jgi:hypothetical protein